MDNEQIKQNIKLLQDFIWEYKAIILLFIIVFVNLYTFTKNNYLSKHLEECRIQNELYKQNPPRIEPGKGGYDSWESSIRVEK
jgi:hypothetical protein